MSTTKTLPLRELIEQRKGAVLSLFFTAGYPGKDDTGRILTAVEAAGGDLVEIGMPFSDPLADGPTIQASSEVALENGMTVKLLFEQLRDARKSVSLPIVLMGYLNPVLQFGVEAFGRACQEVGVGSLILPDLPLELYEAEYKPIWDQYDLGINFLVTPQTSEDRIRKAASLSKDFLYLVSDHSLTGGKAKFSPGQVAYFERIQALKLDVPQIIGFGISDAGTFQNACEYAHGAIIGSAFIRALSSDSDPVSATSTFIQSIRS